MEKAKSDLRNYGRIVKIVQLLVSVVFPVGEAIVVNLATAATGRGRTELFGLLAVVAAIHAVLSIAVLVSTTPLPQFLVEFDDLSENFREMKAHADASASFIQTYNATLLATQLSLLAVETRRLDPRRDLKAVLEEVMASWVENRTEVFRFLEGNTLYNFAIFEYIEQEGALKARWRSHDNRMKIRNRSWKPGMGHVGACYLKGKTLFSNDASAAGDDTLITTEEPDDKKQYRSMLSTPILLDGKQWGVFVVTSSKAQQFDNKLHSPIVEVIALLLGQAIRHCWTKSQ